MSETFGATSGTLSYVDGDRGDRGTFKAPCLILLGVADRPEVASTRYSLGEVELVLLGRGQTSTHGRSHDGRAPLLRLEVPDPCMSSRHAQLRCDAGAWTLRDSGSKNGCYHNGQRCGEALLRDGDVIGTGNTSFLFREEVERGPLEPVDACATQLRTQPIAAQTLSFSLARMMVDISKVSTSSVSIILGGETGTGKEVSARYVHDCSGRRGQFVAVNCGALPANLVESELFGHRKGAFSGAISERVGLVQSSDGGTLFLDEVAELPLEAQVKLLRCLQEREVVPVGATRPIPVDLRVVAATHADLPALVQRGAFRADLYSRLAGVSFHLPPLRERKEDLGLLISTLLARCSVDRPLRFERNALWAMAMYSWPRNIRELEQALTAATAWAEGGCIELGHLPAEVAAALDPSEPSVVDELRETLISTLRKHRGNVSATAREMGKARVQIRRWCERYGIDPASWRR